MSEEENKIEQKDGCLDTGCGCGCAIILLILVIKLIVWAWQIHWFFGLLILLIVLGFFK